MKIYNEVVLQWDDKTQQFNTIYEDYEDYNGPVALAQGLPPQATAISAQSTVSDTIKTTAGYFTGGDGTLSGVGIHTGSLSDSNEKYYFNVLQAPEASSSAEVQFSATYGHIAGSGSNQYGDSTDTPANIIGETQAIYRQFASMLLQPSEISGGFKISAHSDAGIYGSSKARDEYVYILIAKREKFKDRVNKKAWTINFSGSNSVSGSGVSLSLTDDSDHVAAISTPSGPRYNIVSGSQGSPTGSDGSVAYKDKTYGFIWPERGLFVFSGAELSASIPGGPSFGTTPLSVTSSILTDQTYVLTGSANIFDNVNVGDIIRVVSGSSEDAEQVTHITTVTEVDTTNNAISMSEAWPGSSDQAAGGSSSIAHIGHLSTNSTASFSTTNAHRHSSSGFAPNLDATGNSFNALRLVNCMRNFTVDNVVQLRSEEDATQENYFCRISAVDYNFSSNPTFVSGSKNKIRQKTMWGNPSTFITGVGLYNSAGQLLAIASLSKPLKKNYASEATIKVKLTY